ncbi:protein FLX-like 4 isoform X2 [Prosopis cineraria]|uniref:protein FLX-like 4 isoform X2 n=1 Tax=Prosopis cineraria TaxID=364024 RepID=UPI002410A79C|nr:protein FLX-like 4 isoform X2 [Prosopis cineraria]XP_054820380.1 protein FLX-like 4 isoform X2 [Prosopis cineraria]
MAARGNIPAAFERRSVQAPGMMRHGPYPGVSSSAGHPSLEPLPPQMLGDKIASQEAEIKQLVGDNRRLASTHVTLREDLVAAQQQVQKLKAHIRSIQTESDIQIRVLLDKIAKMERDIRAGENVKKELKLAHLEAQSLVAARQELNSQVERATQELKKVRGDVKSLPDLQDELDGLLQEHQRLRATFEYEKSKNVELVEQLKATEKNLIVMAREVEFLRAEIQNVEKRTRAPNLYGAAAAAIPSTFVDGYGRAQAGETAMAYGGEGANGTTAVTSAAWAGPYDSLVSRK